MKTHRRFLRKAMPPAKFVLRVTRRSRFAKPLALAAALFCSGWLFDSAALAVVTGFDSGGADDQTGQVYLYSYYRGLGANLAEVTGATRFYNEGYTGQNTIAANVEGQLAWTGHESTSKISESFAGTDAVSTVGEHPTMCCNVMAGNAGSALGAYYGTGIAKGATLQSGAIATYVADDYFNTSVASVYSTYRHFFGTADVINSSWGDSTDTMATGPDTNIIEALAYANAAATTMVCAAGNDGPTTNTVGGPASGYNCISVGALGRSNSATNYSTIADFSSRGLSDFYNPATNKTITGVRATVDICAPGYNIAGAYTTSASGEYYTASGTSFAAPIVAGGVSLLKSASKAQGLSGTSLDARVVKAVLMNSATKPAVWSNAQTKVNNVVTTTRSLDATYGAGILNLDAAYDQYLSGTKDVYGLAGGAISALGWDYATLSSVGAHNDYTFAAALLADTTLSVTLTWFCDRTVDSTSGAATYNSFADLDLLIYDSSDNLIATSKSDYNESEHLYFTLSATDTYTIRVSYDSETFGTAEATLYGLAWSGTAVPEPGQLAMLLIVVGIGLIRWRLARSN